MNNKIIYPVLIKGSKFQAPYRKPTFLEILKSLFGVKLDLKNPAIIIFEEMILNENHLLSVCNQYFEKNNEKYIFVTTLNLKTNFYTKIKNLHFKEKRFIKIINMFKNMKYGK